MKGMDQKDARHRISLACDHAGFEMKQAVLAFLKEHGYTVFDRGCEGTESVDYPAYAHLVCGDLQKGLADLGILICGTGIGMSIAANKHKGIRAALCDNEFCAEMTRRHNDANVLCLGARVTDVPTALKLVEIFISTSFEHGRHEKRVAMLNALENGFFS